MPLDQMLLDLRRNCGSIASAVVSRDGLVIAADLPREVSKETFSIMCAAIMGAGLTATNELRRSSPRRIVVESPDVRIAIYEAGRKSMLVVAFPSDGDMAEVDLRAQAIVRAIKKD